MRHNKPPKTPKPRIRPPAQPPNPLFCGYQGSTSQPPTGPPQGGSGKTKMANSSNAYLDMANSMRNLLESQKVSRVPAPIPTKPLVDQYGNKIMSLGPLSAIDANGRTLPAPEPIDTSRIIVKPPVVIEHRLFPEWVRRVWLYASVYIRATIKTVFDVARSKRPGHV